MRNPFKTKQFTFNLLEKEADDVIKNSKYAKKYYNKSLEYYYPELDEDWQSHLDNPHVQKSLQAILANDEKERLRSLAQTEQDARQDYYKLKANSVTTPIVGAGSITAGTATLFGESLAVALGVSLTTLLWPIGVIGVVGAAAFLAYSLYSSNKDKEVYAENRTKEKALEFQLKHVQYLNKNTNPHAVADTALEKRIEEKLAEIKRQNKKVEILREFNQLNPKQLPQKLLLGIVGGAAVGGFVFPLLPFAFAPAIGVVLGVLIGFGLAAVATETMHRVKQHMFIKKELRYMSGEYVVNKAVTKGDTKENALDDWLKEHSPSTSTNSISSTTPTNRRTPWIKRIEATKHENHALIAGGI